MEQTRSWVPDYRMPRLRPHWLEGAFVLALIALLFSGVGALERHYLTRPADPTSRTQALLLAQSILDRVRANPAAADFYDGVRCTAAGCRKGGTARITAPDCPTGRCDPEAVAMGDLLQWRDRINESGQRLPGAEAELRRGRDTWIVHIRWDHGRHGLRFEAGA